MKNKKPKRSYRAYQSWKAMKARCTDPKRPNYHLYGGRGVTVCERWNSFDNFLEDMGERPKGHLLGLIDKYGKYELSNCKWTTIHEISVRGNPVVNEDLSGQQFGDWFLIKKVYGKGEVTKYLCRCACGTESIIRASHLKANESTKCKKCVPKWAHIASQELIGKKFGQRLVIGVSDKRTIGGSLLYLCECVCGKIQELTRHKLEIRKNESCKSCYVKFKQRQECPYCGCRGHQDIDLETSLCDLIGFCSRCDGFSMEKFKKSLAGDY